MNQIKNFISINENPFILFKKWFSEAKQKEINNANAMNIATVGADSTPNSRIVLLKSYDTKGFVFFTNLNSHKGIEINHNNKVVLNFYWKSLLKQIRIKGVAKLVSNDEADNYYNTRSRESQIGSWASNQSSELKRREDLEYKFEEYKKKFSGNNIDRPHYWSGFRVDPNLIEFWQEKPHRLHDRVEFLKIGNQWIGKRLFP